MLAGEAKVLKCDSQNAYVPNPHSPTATTRPVPVRLSEISLSSAFKYASGPPLNLSNSLDRVG
jgi:hypothetical protein